MPGALSTEATFPPLNLLWYSQMGALLSGEQRAGRRFGCLSPPRMSQDQAQLLQISPCQEHTPQPQSSPHPQDMDRSQHMAHPHSALSPSGTHGRGAGMRFGGGVQALLDEATLLIPICSLAASPSSRAAEKGHGEGASPTSQEQVPCPRGQTGQAGGGCRMAVPPQSSTGCERQPTALPTVTVQ